MNSREQLSPDSERSFEDLLGRVSPRPVPPHSDIKQVREAVRAEWRASTTAHRRHRRWLSLAAAASVLGVLAVVVSFLQTASPPSLQVASIDRSVGSIYLLRDQAMVETADSLTTIMTPQTIETGADSALGVLWGSGGSLRLHERTRVTFVGSGVIELQKGRLYFDSAGMPSGDSLDVRTPLGLVRHVGTRYMVSVDGSAQTLDVSVREGRVSIEGLYHDPVASVGQRLRLVGSTRPRIEPIVGYGEEWRWIERVAPQPSFAGKPAIELLRWIERETGLTLRFGTAVSQHVERESIRVALDADPRTALHQALEILDLHGEVDGGFINITEREIDDD